ncbi:translation initiation factor IF-2-like [Cervus elaphus]|uniref:translation initiation factor IF-2-like n=1 Tax=Cervus elaphus TaxID=9860 RepID=UPI001CC31CF7|nr:translation initiation factor IF-2-like [Cervus elaphus]
MPRFYVVGGMGGLGFCGSQRFLAAVVGAGSWIPAPHSPQPRKIKGIDDALLGPSPFGVAFAPLVGLRFSLVHAPELSGRGRRRGRGSRSAVGIAPGGAGIRWLLSRLDFDSRFLSGVHRVGDEAEAVGGGPRGPRFQVVFIFVRVLLPGFAAGGASPLPAPRVVGKIHFESSPFPLKRPESRRPTPWAPVWISGRRRGGHTPPRPGRGGGAVRRRAARRCCPSPASQASPPAAPAGHAALPGSPLFSHRGRPRGGSGPHHRLSRRRASAQAANRAAAPRSPPPRRKRARLPQGDRSIHHARHTAEQLLGSSCPATSRGGASGRQQLKEDQNNSPPSAKPGAPPTPTQTRREPRAAKARERGGPPSRPGRRAGPGGGKGPRRPVRARRHTSEHPPIPALLLGPARRLPGRRAKRQGRPAAPQALSAAGAAPGALIGSQRPGARADQLMHRPGTAAIGRAAERAPPGPACEGVRGVGAAVAPGSPVPGPASEGEAQTGGCRREDPGGRRQSRPLPHLRQLCSLSGPKFPHLQIK